MRDPVILPSSKAVVDRKTIKQQLLSVPQDPFNRSQLAIEDVIPGMTYIHPITFWPILTSAPS